MGFDFRMVKVPPTVPEGYRGLPGYSPEEYQLSGWGMGLVGKLMIVSGVLDVSIPMPKLAPSFMGRTVENLKALLGLGRVATLQERLELSADDSNRVPAYKFSTNDGWLVTENECRAIAAALNALTPELKELARGDSRISQAEFEKLGKSWAQYNEAASQNGGYRVN
jgi:hypothetical protein